MTQLWLTEEMLVKSFTGEFKPLRKWLPSCIYTGPARLHFPLIHIINILLEAVHCFLWEKKHPPKTHVTREAGLNQTVFPSFSRYSHSVTSNEQQDMYVLPATFHFSLCESSEAQLKRWDVPKLDSWGFLWSQTAAEEHISRSYLLAVKWMRWLCSRIFISVLVSYSEGFFRLTPSGKPWATTQLGSFWIQS